MLDEVDQILQQRGHKFVRYADDCNIYVRSQRSGERVLRSLVKIYTKLKLQVNEAKTAVGLVFGRKFLGYCFRRWTGNTVKIAVAPKALSTFKDRVRKITSRNGGRSMTQVAEQLRDYLPGWKAYFCLAKTPSTFKELDSWIRHRLRAIQVKQWRRGKTIYRKLKQLGASENVATKAANVSGRWWGGSMGHIHCILTVEYFDKLGFPRLT